MLDISGKDFGRTACKSSLLVGSQLSVGGRNIEVESMISKEDFLAGRPFLGNVKESPPSLREIDQTDRVTNKAQARHDKIAATQKENLHPTVTSTAATKGAFKTPLLNNTVQLAPKNIKEPTPRHNPNAEDASL